MSMDCRGFREKDVWKILVLRPSKLTVPILSFTQFLFPPKIYLHAIQYMHVNPRPVLYGLYTWITLIGK